MRVRFFATLRQFVGAKEVEVNVGPGDTVRHALQQLEAEYPALQGRILGEQRDLKKSLNIFVSGRSIKFKQGLDTVLQEGDVLAIFPPLAGG